MPMIDFHAHILPRADHGSDSSATTRAQLALMQSAGVDAVVATPHFYPDRDNAERFLYRRAEAAERLLRKCDVARPTVYLGAEVAVCPHLEKIGEETLEKLCINGTRVILLEMPTDEWRAGYLDAVRAIGKLGFTVVLAHLDRYPKKEVEKLTPEGFFGQLNATAFYKLFAKKRYIEMASTEGIVALGSDLHGASEKAYAQFARLRGILPAAEAVFQRTAKLLEGAIPLTAETLAAVPGIEEILAHREARTPAPAGK